MEDEDLKGKRVDLNGKRSWQSLLKRLKDHSTIITRLLYYSQNFTPFFSRDSKSFVT